MQQTTDVELLQDNQHSEETEQVDETLDVEQENKIKEDDYKNLQSTYTKANQERIELAKKLVEKDKSEILNIKDKKLQNKVVKDLYWYDNLEELQAIHWDKFFNVTKSDEDDDLTTLQQKVRLMEYRAERNQVDIAIKNYLSENKITDEDAVDKLKDELKYISKDLEVDERVRRAWKITFNNNTSWYLAMSDKVIKTQTKVEDKQKDTKVSEEFSSILRKYL